ncbi:hypothetical protein HK102_004697 [Quaeritorhiza haematococci]|nr:hypothetical protein HK102_004697 [Quaeritorhiza haematococci]
MVAQINFATLCAAGLALTSTIVSVTAQPQEDFRPPIQCAPFCFQYIPDLQTCAEDPTVFGPLAPTTSVDDINTRAIEAAICVCPVAEHPGMPACLNCLIDSAPQDPRYLLAQEIREACAAGVLEDAGEDIWRLLRPDAPQPIFTPSAGGPQATGTRLAPQGRATATGTLPPRPTATSTRVANLESINRLPTQGNSAASLSFNVLTTFAASLLLSLLIF